MQTIYLFFYEFRGSSEKILVRFSLSSSENAWNMVALTDSKRDWKNDSEAELSSESFCLILEGWAILLNL